jgi:hypothetical protein
MTILINPSLGANQKLYAGGSNTCFKAITKGGPTPTQITDTSGRGNHGVFTTAPEPVLVGDLWCYQFVSGDSEYVTVPDITELLGATEATWCAWVRKDAYVYRQSIANEYASDVGWRLGFENSENLWWVHVATANAQIAGAFTTGWHFCWMRFVANNATGLSTGVDNASATGDTTGVASIENSAYPLYIGRWIVYSSMTLGALAIWPSAISDAEIQKWRYHVKRQLGV